MLVPLRLSAWTSLRSKKLRCDFGQERCIMQEWITRRATAQRAVSEVWFIRGNIGSNRESTGSWRRRIYGGRKSRWLGLIESCVERRSQWDFASSAISKVVQRNITNWTATHRRLIHHLRLSLHYYIATPQPIKWTEIPKFKPRDRFCHFQTLPKPLK